MSATPNSQQIADIRMDLGIVAAAFQDSDISRFWQRVDTPTATNPIVQFEACMCLMARAAWASIVNYRDYGAGTNNERMSQVVTQMQALAKLYEPSLKKAQGRKQIAIGSLRQGAPMDEQPVENTPNNPYNVQFPWQEIFK